MRKIIHLPDAIVSKIAAGEVIERPAYAVKELIENSIDAGADFIEISIEDAGLTKISIRDNGEGMSKQDLEICFLPHTTSKIKEVGHLIGIQTLGFRGEALSSIAAISDLTIKSRRKESIAGTVIMTKNGNIESSSTVGMPYGTVVDVEHIFYSIPVRKKFLKSQQTEFRHISNVVSAFALCYPGIHFRFTHNNKIILDLSKKEESEERVKYILGETLFNFLIPFTFEDGYIHLKGFLGKPQAAQKNNQKQLIFINNRFVSDNLIALAVKESYGTLLPSSSTPVFLLSLSIPPEMVDVNIHPRKEQVAFINGKVIFDFVKQAVSQTLQEHNLTFRLAKFKHETSGKISETTSTAGMVLKHDVLDSNITSLGNVLKKSSYIQLQKAYILVSTDKGFSVFDQHAAHERVLYERLRQSFEEKKHRHKRFVLPKPVTLTLSLSDFQRLEEYKQDFEFTGFEIEHFQGTSIIIRAIPEVFTGRNIQSIILDMVTDLESTNLLSLDVKTQRMIAFLSCRAAVKTGDPLQEKQMKELITTLEKTERNETCPHGRPTRIDIQKAMLDKWFNR